MDQAALNRPAKPMKAMDRMPAMIRLVHGRPADQPGYRGQLGLLAQAGHQHQCQGEADAGTQSIDYALGQPAALVGGEDGQPEDRTVGGDQRQEGD
jgi:hypothetical protein